MINVDLLEDEIADFIRDANTIPEIAVLPTPNTHGEYYQRPNPTIYVLYNETKNGNSDRTDIENSERDEVFDVVFQSRVRRGVGGVSYLKDLIIRAVNGRRSQHLLDLYRFDVCFPFDGNMNNDKFFYICRFRIKAFYRGSCIDFIPEQIAPKIKDIDFTP